jgi:hypothetical protein
MYVQARFDVTWVRSKNRKSSSSSSGCHNSRSTSDRNSAGNSNHCVGGSHDIGADGGVGEETQIEQREDRGKIRGSAVVYVHGTARLDWR